MIRAAQSRWPQHSASIKSSFYTVKAVDPVNLSAKDQIRVVTEGDMTRQTQLMQQQLPMMMQRSLAFGVFTTQIIWVKASGTVDGFNREGRPTAAMSRPRFVAGPLAAAFSPSGRSIPRARRSSPICP